jgi:hypothetical protein
LAWLVLSGLPSVVDYLALSQAAAALAVLIA